MANYTWMLEVLDDLRTFAKSHELPEADKKLREVMDTVLDEVPFRAYLEIRNTFGYSNNDMLTLA